MTGKQYKQHREQMGLTQASLAQCLGIARETVVRREASEGLVSREAQIAIRSLWLASSSARKFHPANTEVERCQPTDHE